MLRCMRTTLALDDDVASILDRMRRAQHVALRDAVNEALRRGLREMAAPRLPRKKRYETRVANLGACLVRNIDDVSETLAVTEGGGFR